MREGRLELLRAPLDPLTLEQTVAAVDEAVTAGGSVHHASVNAAKVVSLQDDDELRRALWDSDLVTADGQAIVWAARALGCPVPERVAGIDLMNALLERAVDKGHGVFMLGARREVVEAAAEELRRRYPGIRLLGTRDGYFDRTGEADVVAEVSAVKPDLLFVALPTPEKELFLARNREALAASFAMGVGGAFDVLSGRLRRAPPWMQRAGLEWLYRLLQEPRRLAWRYAAGNTRFVALVARDFMRERRKRSSR